MSSHPASRQCLVPGPAVGVTLHREGLPGLRLATPYQSVTRARVCRGGTQVTGQVS